MNLAHTLTPYFIKIHLNASSPIYAHFQWNFWIHFSPIPHTILATPSSLSSIRPPLLQLVKNTNYATQHYAVFFVFILLPTPIKFQYSLSILFSIPICVFPSRWRQVGRCSSHILDTYIQNVPCMTLNHDTPYPQGISFLFNYFVIFLSPPDKYQDQISIEL